MSSKHFKTIALIMAAGRGHRIGGTVPKQYLRFKGRQILTQAMMSFLNHERVDAVRVVIGPKDQEMYAEAIASISSSKLLAPVLGGDERSESVQCGLESLKELNPHYVLVHDGVRPFVSSDIISSVVEALQTHKGVIPAIPVVDTLKRVFQDQIEITVDRQHLYQAQTPQGFDYSTLVDAYQKLGNAPVLTDDASLLEHLHIPVHIVPGELKNRKITTIEDLEGGHMSVPDIRVGHGFDAHAIEPGKGITLLGIFIPVTFALVGHSDADVGLHSLTDALLGSIGDGDLGQHFNPKDDRWKGADSVVFLKDAVRRVQEKGGAITHVDVTILAERPKVAPYRQQMIARVAEILGIEQGRVSVKATTTEKLGFVGREEGLAALATATVVFHA